MNECIWTLTTRVSRTDRCDSALGADVNYVIIHFTFKFDLFEIVVFVIFQFLHCHAFYTWVLGSDREDKWLNNQSRDFHEVRDCIVLNPFKIDR